MLDLLFTPAAYAEDQPHSRLILSVHVIHRGFNLGSFVGITSSLAIASFQKLRAKPGLTSPHLFSNSLKFASRGGLIGLGFGAVALTGRMYSKDLIEWQDRSWRLLQHPTQNQTDYWSIAGAGVGVFVTGVVYKAVTPRALFGGAAIGSSSAIIAMLAYRALRGGKI
ncbi:hypothetical protein CBS101457_005118 [Exobasidium rhododendri]|nr:hypothetical protein CBS101457_005118 [Exobasidium rhododendri]